MPELERRLVLIGGGHSHLFVVEALARRPEPRLQVTVVSPSALSTYSGMTPGVLAGRYALRAAQIDLARLAGRAAATFVAARVSAIDAQRRVLALSDGSTLSYDLASFDIGAQPTPPPVSEAGIRPIPIKPIETALAALDERLASRDARSVAVVGAGAGGTEVAFALAARLCGVDGAIVTLCDRTAHPVPTMAPRAIRLVERALAERGVRFLGGAEIAALEATSLRLRSGGALAADALVWATGVRGPTLFADAGLPVDERGFLIIGADLCCAARPEVFAAGDCATLAPYPTLPKAGVYAVRQGPILARNLRAAARGEALTPYRPQARFLALLNTGDGRAILSYGRFACHTRWAWWLKDRIDRAFVRRFDR